MSTSVLIVLALVAIGAIVGLIVVGMRNSRADYPTGQALGVRRRSGQANLEG